MTRFDKSVLRLRDSLGTTNALFCGDLAWARPSTDGTFEAIIRWLKHSKSSTFSRVIRFFACLLDFVLLEQKERHNRFDRADAFDIRCRRTRPVR